MKTDLIVLSYSHPDPLQAPLVNPSHRLRFGSSPETHPTQSSSASYASQTASSHSASEARHIGSIILRLLVTLSLPTLQSYEVHSFGSAYLQQRIPHYTMLCPPLQNLLLQRRINILIINLWPLFHPIYFTDVRPTSLTEPFYLSK